jgi:acetyl-CoA C-acetyltransferase
MFIKGVGMTKFGVDSRSSQSLVYEAVMNALDDADIGAGKIDAVAISNIDVLSNGERQRHAAAFLSSILKLEKKPIVRIPAGCAGGGAALWLGEKLNYDNVLVVGYDKLVGNHTTKTTDEILMGAERIWEQTEGMIFPAQNALVAQQHMFKYGSTSDDLALIAHKNHENAKINPNAFFYGKEVSLEKIKESKIVASPLRLFDCSVSVNGAAACIITKDKTDVEIKGSSLQSDYLTTFEREDMTTWDANVNAAKDAYKKAGVEASDIDFVEIHDAFTPVEMMSYEDLGFIEKGKGQELIRNGDTKMDGKLPVNTSGGLKAKGHPISATGLSQIYEIVKQMRGLAGDRQLTKKNWAIAHNIGGAGATVAVHVLNKVSA